MAKVTKEALKEYFQTGDRPTESEFVNLIDSLTHEDTVEAHVNDTNNPHQVTKAQVGLENVDNTSDANKPISTATQAALTALAATLEGGGASPLEKVDQGNGEGIIIKDRDETYMKPVGVGAMDLSIAVTGNDPDQGNWGASGEKAFAAGKNNLASGNSSFAIGDGNVASGESAISLGTQNESTNRQSMAMGAFNRSNGSQSLTLGYDNDVLSENHATAVGVYNTCENNMDFAFGESNNLMSSESKGEGRNVGIGTQNQIKGYTNYVTGWQNQIEAHQSLTQGIQNQTEGDYCFNVGYQNNIQGSYSVGFGYQIRSFGNNNVNVGYGNLNEGNSCTAIGYQTNVNKEARDSVSIGRYNNVFSQYCSALGQSNQAKGNSSSAVGYGNNSEAPYSYAGGVYSTAKGDNSFAFGFYAIANSYKETALGTNNTEYVPNSVNEWDASDRLLVIGNGEDSSNKNDALTIFKNGAFKLHPIALSNVTNPSEGMMIMDSEDANQFKFYNGVSWVSILGGKNTSLETTFNKTFTDIDNTTVINVIPSPGEGKMIVIDRVNLVVEVTKAFPNGGNTYLEFFIGEEKEGSAVFGNANLSMDKMDDKQLFFITQGSQTVSLDALSVLNKPLSFGFPYALSGELAASGGAVTIKGKVIYSIEDVDALVS